MQPAIVGTFLTVLGAAVLAIPLGMMGAVYLNEYGKTDRLASFIRFMTDVMVGCPSVVMGVFIYSIWVVEFGATGKSAFAASLALGMSDVADRRAIDRGDAAARARTPPRGVRRARHPHVEDHRSASCSRPRIAGITSGSLLAVARAAGETAPVVFTIGFVTRPTGRCTGQNTSLSAQIYSQLATEAPLATQLAWGAAVTLVGIVLVLTLAARGISNGSPSDDHHPSHFAASAEPHR